MKLGKRQLAARRFSSSSLLLLLGRRLPIVTAMVSASSSTAGGTPSTMKIIDSHVHVWANTAEATTAFPYVVDPPAHLKDSASTDELISRMDRHGVAGAIIVQPINHKFDHSYVERAIWRHPDRFKGMLLHDPSMSVEDATAAVRELAPKGFAGVRFNPYLWPEVQRGSVDADDYSPPTRALMSESGGSGLAVYSLCGELGLPVGIMCMQGFGLHVDDIESLLQASPSTALVLDHYGFTTMDETGDHSFAQLLSMVKQYPQVVVKLSAPFRLSTSKSKAFEDDPSQFEQVREQRFAPLLQAIGSSRLLYGSDFPYVLDHVNRYGDMVDVISSWIESESDRQLIMGGNAERLFGPWGGVVDLKSTFASSTAGSNEL